MLKYLVEKLSRFPFLYGRITFLKFFIAGGFCGLLDLLLIYYFTDILGLWYLYSGILSFIIVSVVSFSLNKNITFKDKNENLQRQYLKYVLVILIGMTINNSFLYIFTDLLGVWYVVSRVFSSLIALIWNYTASKKFVFLVKKSIKSNKYK